MTNLERQLMQMVSVLIEQLKEIDVSIDRMQNQLMEVTSAVDNLDLTVNTKIDQLCETDSVFYNDLLENLKNHWTPNTAPAQAKPEIKEKSTPEGRYQKAVAKLEGLFDLSDDKDKTSVYDPGGSEQYLPRKCAQQEGNCKAANCMEHGIF